MTRAPTTVRSLPPCGGGLGRGVAPEKVPAVDDAPRWPQARSNLSRLRGRSAPSAGWGLSPQRECPDAARPPPIADAPHRRGLRGRRLKAACASPASGRGSRPPSWHVNTSTSGSPPPGTSSSPRLNFAPHPPDHIAVHNVDMLGSDTTGRWTKHLFCSAFPVFRSRQSSRRNGLGWVGGRARRLTPFFFIVRDQP
jgi:hypothetical protein